MSKKRTKPYTKRGITRVPCFRCGKPSTQQWQICALDNQYLGVCAECDIGMNEVVLSFMLGESTKDYYMNKYRRKNEQRSYTLIAEKEAE